MQNVYLITCMIFETPVKELKIESVITKLDNKRLKQWKAHHYNISSLQKQSNQWTVFYYIGIEIPVQ